MSNVAPFTRHSRTFSRNTYGFRAVRPQREMNEDRNANGAQDEDARRMARGKENNVRCGSSPRRERERDTDDGT